MPDFTLGGTTSNGTGTTSGGSGWSWGDLVPLAGGIISAVAAIKVANAQSDVYKANAAAASKQSTAAVQVSALNSATITKVALIGVGGLLLFGVILVGGRAIAK